MRPGRQGPGSHMHLTEELAHDMGSTVDFARAAYGYAFLSGGLSSISRYLHMQVWSCGAIQRGPYDLPSDSVPSVH